MSETEVYTQYELKFVLMGKHNFVQLIKKPSLSKPVVQFESMESVYESGYFVDMDQNKKEYEPSSKSVGKLLPLPNFLK